jgi:hypothetical protein
MKLLRPCSYNPDPPYWYTVRMIHPFARLGTPIELWEHVEYDTYGILREGVYVSDIWHAPGWGYQGMYWSVDTEAEAEKLAARLRRFPSHCVTRCEGCHGYRRRWMPI